MAAPQHPALEEIARLEAEVAELKLKLDQARGDIRHIREYEVKPRDEAFRELRLNDDIADCVELVLRERGLLEEECEPSFVEGNVSVARDGGGDGDPARRR